MEVHLAVESDSGSSSSRLYRLRCSLYIAAGGYRLSSTGSRGAVAWWW